MEKYSITKSVEFCAAHRLLWHTGKCHGLHGHLFRVVATISRTDKGINENDIVYDLGDLGEALEKIAEKLDHTYLNEQFANPTSENIATHFREQLKRELPSYIEIERIEVWESPNSKVTIECE